MIVGNMKNLATTMLPTKLLTILEKYGTTLANQEDGTYQPESDLWSYTLISTQTEPAEQRRPEFHREYLDIQLLLQGAEAIGYSTLDIRDQQGEEGKADLYFVDHSIVSNRYIMAPGDFAVIFPGEPHQPLCAVQQPMSVRKVIFKIHRDFLA